jgi:hypothetical protein
MRLRISRQIAVLIPLTAAIVACRDPKPPEVNPPPSFASEAPPPIHLPPEERETKVFPLNGDLCGATDTTYIDHTIVEVTARCLGGPSATQVVLTVSSRAMDPRVYLLSLSVRFCGDVVEATGPAGWTVAIEREKGIGGVAGEVRWESPSGSTSHATPRRLSGFSATLRGPWRTGVGHSVVFTQTSGPYRASPHDCPYPFLASSRQAGRQQAGVCQREALKLLGRNPVRVQGKIRAPKKIRHIQPSYPEWPHATVGTGNWIGEALIDEHGKVRQVWVLREPKLTPPFAAFAEAVVEAVRQWEFEPLNVEGVPTPLCMTVVTTFHWQ